MHDDGDPFGYREAFRHVPDGDGYAVNGLEHSWIDGRASLEWPCHPFAGFGAQPSFEMGAFSYASSHISPHVASIGRYCSIADGVVFGHMEHPTRWLTTSSFTYDRFFMGPAHRTAPPYSLFQPFPLPEAKKRRSIVIGNDVWVGHRAYIRAGVRLGDGCIVGANAVVTKDVPPFAIVAGNPARVIRQRFNPGICRDLLELAWWRYDFTRFEAVDIRDPAVAIRQIRALIAAGLKPYEPRMTVLASNTALPALACELVAGVAPRPSLRPQAEWLPTRPECEPTGN